MKNYIVENTNCNVNNRPFAEYPILMKASQVHELLGVGINHIYELVHSNQLRAVYVGRNIMIPQSAVNEYLNSILDECEMGGM